MTTKKLDAKDFAVIFLLASSFGITTLLISELSRLIFKTPLCLSPLSLKNIFKTIILNGGTMTTIVLLGEALGISENEIEKDFGLDSEASRLDDEGKTK